MIKIDFHGKPLEDALLEVEKLIDGVRLNKKTEEAEFITGHGVIKKEIVKLLEGYEIEYEIGFNQGIIKAVIE